MVSPYRLFSVAISAVGAVQAAGSSLYASVQGNSLTTHNPIYNPPSPILRTTLPKLTIGAFPEDSDSDVEELVLPKTTPITPSKTSFPMTEQVWADIQTTQNQEPLYFTSIEDYLAAEEKKTAQGKFKALKEPKVPQEISAKEQDAPPSTQVSPPASMKTGKDTDDAKPTSPTPTKEKPKARQHKVGRKKTARVVFARRVSSAQKPKASLKEEDQSINSSEPEAIKPTQIPSPEPAPSAQEQYTPALPAQDQVAEIVPTKIIPEEIKPQAITPPASERIDVHSQPLTVLPPVPMTAEETKDYEKSLPMATPTPQGITIINHNGTDYKSTVTHRKDENGKTVATEKITPLSFWERLKNKIINLFVKTTKQAIMSVASFSPIPMNFFKA